ncbi:MAG: M20/M25/M40 family metallo-hydrolase [Chloroflexi bacterium]|nr:M20/M25/M40 family metallo-hydrolase [Chloroflexota bacterium]
MDATVERLLDLTIRIQQIPAPTFDERARAEFVRSLFVAEGLSDVSTDEVGNVLGRIPGDDGTAAPLVICAHLDTVFPAGTNLRFARSAERVAGPGIGDNALGVAGLLGLVWLLRERDVRLPGDLWLAATVGEEGLGDLHGMRAVADRFGADVRAYLILEGMALGHVYHRALGVRRYRIHARTAGGHSWSDHGRPSAVHELSALVTKLTALHLPARPRTTLNVGTFSGGTTVNTIAARAYLELDLRSEDAGTLTELARDVEALVETANGPEVRVEAEEIGSRPAGGIPATHPLVRLAEDCLREQGLEPVLTIGSTDANIPFSRGYPAVCLGLTTGGGAHTVDEFIHTRPLGQGMAQFLDFVLRVWGID